MYEVVRMPIAANEQNYKMSLSLHSYDSRDNQKPQI